MKKSARHSLDRRTFLKTTGTLAAGSTLLPWLGCGPRDAGPATAAAATRTGWVVRPFRLDEVSLGAGVFRDKRDRMLYYARSYGGDADVFAGPDRLLAVFRANAGLDTRGAEAVGGWENETGYLRGHYAGHFMSMLAQAWAGTGDEVFKRKLDYMVGALAECQSALAAAARRATTRVPGRHGAALALSGSPLGQAEHVRLPEGILAGRGDFTIATWIQLSLYDAEALPDARRQPVELINQSAVFDFGSPNPDYAEPPRAHMYLTVRDSDEKPAPRFVITASGADGEQGLDGSAPLPVGEWVHVAVAKSGNTGTLYVDGEPVASNPGMTLGPADLGDTADNWLGRRQFPQRNVSYLNAALDDFRIFDRALSGAEVRSSMEAPALGGELAWYRFDETDGPTAVDASGNGRDATVIAPTDGRRHPGFLSAYPETQFVRLEEFATYGGSQGIWAPYYTLHKILAGLLDAHVLAGNRQALDVATGIGDWLCGRLLPLGRERLDRMWNIYIAGEYGGVNESLAHLHALRPDKGEYLEAAERFINTNVYAPTAAGEDVLDGRHANQHIPQFTGYLRTYEEGHDESYYAAARNFWDMVVPHRIYSHGGLGVGEMLRRRDVIAGSLYEDRNHAETCPLYNMLKLSRNLFFHDPDPKYMNYYELGLVNQMLGSRRDADSAESPEVTYFVPVQPGRRRSYGNVGTCCGGTGMESHTKYQDSIYFRSADDSALYVNLYVASTLRWPAKGFTVVQETRYPEEGSSSFVLDGSGPLEVKLRVPAWVRKGFTVRVNGEAEELDAVPGTYLTLSREWRPGDRIDVDMPMSFRVERAVDDPAVQSIYYGPVLLAVQAEPVGDDLASGLLPVSLYRYVKLDGDVAPAMTPTDKPMHFATGGLLLAPFYVADPSAAPPSEPDDSQEPPTQPYHVYLRRHEPLVVFGSVDSGVANPVGSDGLTFLDAVWSEAPFASHTAFVSAVERIAGEWQRAGAFSPAQQQAILDAARRAEEDLRV